MKETKTKKTTHTEKLDFCICQITGINPEQTKYKVEDQMWSAFCGFSHCINIKCLWVTWAIEVNPENLNFVGKTGGQTLERNKRLEDFQRSI